MNYFHQYADEINEMFMMSNAELDDTDINQIEHEVQEMNCRRCQDSGCNYCLMCEY